jgi:hypothetical protein
VTGVASGPERESRGIWERPVDSPIDSRGTADLSGEGIYDFVSSSDDASLRFVRG